MYSPRKSAGESARAGEELAHQGIRVLVRECESMDEQEQIRAIDELLEQHIYGLAIMPVNCAAVRDKLNEVAETYRIPIVTFNSDIIGTRRLCFIGMDKPPGRAGGGRPHGHAHQRDRQHPHYHGIFLPPTPTTAG